MFRTVGVKARKPMALITSYVDGEHYGLLGPQMAATLIEENTPFGCVVVAIGRSWDKIAIKRALEDYFGRERKIIGFSSLSGREDLFHFAREWKDEGALTILAGPQAGVNFRGETGWREHAHRFKGLSDHFTLALQGPAEQIIPLLQEPEKMGREGFPGGLIRLSNGQILQSPPSPWNKVFLGKVRWDNLYLAGPCGLVRHPVHLAQVLQNIGCPHATRPTQVLVDDPSFLEKRATGGIPLTFKGCSFCDVATDKGFVGLLPLDTVLSQIRCLPEGDEGRKIPFELINENALPGIPRLLEACEREGLRLSEIHLTLRADWFLGNQHPLVEALALARRQRVRILLSSMGFETFSDRILRNLNKGLTRQTNLEAIGAMRGIKRRFPYQWFYETREGAVHGFIHPTPWDTQETEAEIQETIRAHGLASDILPPHSVPLIIHHASGLGHWIREIEARENLRFERYGSVIGWWEESLISRSGAAP